MKAFGPFVAMPAAVDMLFGILILVWFLATVVALTQVARQPLRRSGSAALA